MQITGHGGHVRVGYHVAAEMGAWSLTQTRRTPVPQYEASADLVRVDSFWIQQSPIAVTFTIGQRAWSWMDVPIRLVHSESLAVTLVGVPTIH